ncbi:MULTISPECIES: NUDIX domain-containing protein [Amycolatopsis]|uniref:NUDIX domain-containing protein n=1 Tax=Amycolatopsis TaxID=1813 RepID=UPI000B8B6B1B|nr:MULTISPECIES: NUDIX hydrolase [Amycolatopsis]OXM66197.1 NUDIX hydrolase [Amycolatopsis sp. KNN50.9b]
MDLLPFDEYVKALPRKRMAAGVLFRDDANRVLLVEPSYKPYWDLPGGTVDAEEAPWAAATREVREELGLRRRRGDLLVIDHRRSDERLPEGLYFVFDGGLITETEVDSLELTDPEILSARLFTRDELPAKTPPSLVARVEAAFEALRSGRPVLRDSR